MDSITRTVTMEGKRNQYECKLKGHSSGQKLVRKSMFLRAFDVFFSGYYRYRSKLSEAV